MTDAVALGPQFGEVGLERRGRQLIGAKASAVAGALADPVQQLAEFPPVRFDGGNRPSRQRLEILIQQSAFSRVFLPHSGISW